MNPPPLTVKIICLIVSVQVSSKATGADLLESVATHETVNLLEKEYFSTIFNVCQFLASSTSSCFLFTILCDYYILTKPYLEK